MKSKSVVLTGATSGIGKSLLKSLAAKNYSIAVVVRNANLGKATIEEISKATGNQDIRLFVCDLASLEAVRNLAVQLQSEYPVIDILINNAGLINETRILTVDGYEHTWAVNHLAPFLLTHLLLPNLEKSGEGRIINLASEAQKMGRINLGDLNAEKSFSSFGSYCQSKLANVIFTQELARRIKSKSISVFAVHPGVVKTQFGAGLKGFTSTMFKISAPFMRNADKGAETPLWLATMSKAPESGGYYHDKKLIQPNAQALDVALVEAFWNKSCQMTGIEPIKAH